MKHLDLFSGIGGFSLAARWTWKGNYENVGHCEIEEFPCKVYHKHFPESRCLGDITKVEWKKGMAEMVTGGFPCQPFSLAGKQNGREDDRYLWKSMFKAIQEIKPNWVVAENVPGIINMALDEVLSDLEGEAYEVQTFDIPACAIDAPHRRSRIWIIAHANGVGCKRGKQGMQETHEERYDKKNLSSRALRSNRARYGLPSSRICRGIDDVPNKVDRLASLGNAIVPQVAFEIFKRILEVEKQFERGV